MVVDFKQNCNSYNNYSLLIPAVFKKNLLHANSVANIDKKRIVRSGVV